MEERKKVSKKEGMEVVEMKKTQKLFKRINGKFDIKVNTLRQESQALMKQRNI